MQQSGSDSYVKVGNRFYYEGDTDSIIRRNSSALDEKKADFKRVLVEAERNPEYA